jgi:hypothetical protein
MDEATKRSALLRAKARKFAEIVRGNPGFAFNVPDEIADTIEQKDFPEFFEHCKTFRIVRRDDWKWEARP